MLNPAYSKLFADIRVIFSQVTSAEEVYTFRQPERAVAYSFAKLAANQLPSVVNPEDVELKHDQVILLKTLYARQPP